MVVVHMLHRARGVAKSPWVSTSSHLPANLRGRTKKTTTILRSLSRGRRRSGREDRVERRTPALAVGRLAPTKQRRWSSTSLCDVRLPPLEGLILLFGKLRGNFYFLFFGKTQDEVSDWKVLRQRRERSWRRKAQRGAKRPGPRGTGGETLREFSGREVKAQ